MPIYMKFDGIEGDVHEVDHENWHEAFSFSWGESLAISNTGAGGGSTGRVSMSDLNVMMSSGKGSPLFMFYCASGRLLPAVQMEVVRPTEGHGLVLQRWTLSNAMITSFQVSGSGGESPTEAMSLNFTKIKYEQAVVEPNGLVRYQNCIWDVRANTGSFVP